MNQIIDFVNTTGKNIGKVQNTKLANYLNVSEGAIRALRDKDTLKFECLYLGAICKANNISREDLLSFLQKDEDSISS